MTQEESQLITFPKHTLGLNRKRCVRPGPKRGTLDGWNQRKTNTNRFPGFSRQEERG